MMLSVASVNLIKTKDRNKQKKGKNCFKTGITIRGLQIRAGFKDFKSVQKD